MKSTSDDAECPENGLFSFKIEEDVSSRIAPRRDAFGDRCNTGNGFCTFFRLAGCLPDRIDTP